MADQQQPIDSLSNRETGSSFLDDINYHRMAEFFDVSSEDRRDQHIAEEISFLTDWAKSAGLAKDDTEAKFALKSLAKNMGIPYTGKELVKKLYQWARLDQDRKRIEKEMEAISVNQS